MSTTSLVETPSSALAQQDKFKILDQYGCGPIRFAGSDSGLYDRHLLFDNVIDQADADARDRFEAFARSVRDVLSQRWTLTEKTYERENPKRIYYLSMEFLIGRSLANNVTNMLLSPLVDEAALERHLDLTELLEQEPDAALGNGGLGRLAACFLESMATLHLPGMGYGLRYEYGIFKQSFQNGWQAEQPDNWLRRHDPWEVARPQEKVEVELACSVDVHGGTLKPAKGLAVVSHVACGNRIKHAEFDLRNGIAKVGTLGDRADLYFARDRVA